MSELLPHKNNTQIKNSVRKKRKEAENHPRTITCGMLFKVVEFGRETQNVHVIIDIDAGNTFYACRISK